MSGPLPQNDYYGARFYSPYINRFLSADTIVPSYANPQSLNRYSYVTNNPLRYTDPTGHRMVEDEGSTRGGLDCRKFSKYCTNGKKKSDEELQAMSPEPTVNHKQELRGGFADLFPGGIAASWGPPNDLDPADFEELLAKIRSDVHQTPPELLILKSPRYDTPFYNRNGKFSGTGCLTNGKCYDRSELNYIGQGELWSALGFTKERTHQVVSVWKETIYGHPPSEKALEMTDMGYDNYQELYPPSSPNYNYEAPYFIIPWEGGDS